MLLGADTAQLHQTRHSAAAAYLLLQGSAFRDRDVFFLVCNFRFLVCEGGLLLPRVARGPGLAHALLPGLQLGPRRAQLLAQPADLRVAHVVAVVRAHAHRARPEVEQAGAEAEVAAAEARHVAARPAAAALLPPEVGGDGAEEAEAVRAVEQRVAGARDVHGVRSPVGEEAGAGQPLRDGVAGAVPGLVPVQARAVARLGCLGEARGLARLARRVSVQIRDAEVI